MPIGLVNSNSEDFGKHPFQHGIPFVNRLVLLRTEFGGAGEN
jgi:hypothetical protein